ncbi:MAG: T9SS type A sorting domain-containing protein [Bacteroidota bacterium]
MLRLALTLCAVAFFLRPQAASAQAPPDSSLSYFPLEIGNSWTYLHVLQHPFMPWDTLYHDITIDETVVVNDTSYFVVPLFRALSDTLRTDETGDRVWMRYRGHDVLFLDFTVAPDSSYSMLLPDAYGGYDYHVRREDREYIRTDAGDFAPLLGLHFRIPELLDSNLYYAFVRGVGIVNFGGAWIEGYRLSAASVGGRTVTSVHSLPTTQRIMASVYPNPARDRVTLTVPSPHHTPLSINAFDMLGRRVAQWQAAGDCDGSTCRADLGVGDLAPGTYLLQASQGDWTIAHPLIVHR